MTTWKGFFRLFALSLTALAASAATASAEPAVGIVYNTNILASFDTAKPETFTDARLVTGLGPREVLEDVDYRWHPSGDLKPPPPPQLYGLGVTYDVKIMARLYTIDLATGVATLVGPPVEVPYGNTYGIDFNPVADRVRVVTDDDGNFRINPNNGALSGSDTGLTPAGNKATDVAYDRVGIASPQTPPAATTAYVIGTAANRLFTLGGVNGAPSPNGGTLENSLPLGQTLSPGAPVGFDIDPAGEAFATMSLFATNFLVKVDLATGATTLVDKTPVALSGLAIVPPTEPPKPPPAIVAPDTKAPTVSTAGVPKSLTLAKFLKGISLEVTRSEPASLDAELLAAAKGAKLASLNLDPGLGLLEPGLRAADADAEAEQAAGRRPDEAVHGDPADHRHRRRQERGRCHPDDKDQARPEKEEKEEVLAGDLEQERDRAVVDEGDSHAGSEDALLRVKALAEAVVEGLGRLARRRVDIAGPIAVARVSVKCELADAENLAVAERLVEAALGVVEDPQGADLVGKPVGLLLAVADRDPEQDQEPGADLGDPLALDVDRGLADSLYERPHPWSGVGVPSPSK